MHIFLGNNDYSFFIPPILVLQKLHVVEGCYHQDFLSPKETYMMHKLSDKQLKTKT